MKRKNENGITLIALVVTIIILLILAGVTIGFAMNGSGLFDKAKSATEEYNNKAKEEAAILANYENEIDDYISGARNTYTNNYSLKEQVVGTWIDGKPIYQISFWNVDLEPGEDKTFLTLPENTNLERIIWQSYSATLYGGSINLGTAPNSVCSIISSDGVTIKTFSANNKTMSGGVYTIQYTKTTDKATVTLE